MNPTVTTAQTGQDPSAAPGAAGPRGPVYFNLLGMELVRFEPGTFIRGVGNDLRVADVPGDGLDWDEQPAHPVTLTAPFYMLKTGVSKAHFDRAGLGAAPEDGRVSWERAAAFCAWLSRKEGLTYRLPTEAEWEYVRRNPGAVTDFRGEWVGDWHGAYRNVSLRDPAGPATGVVKVIRSAPDQRASQPPSVENKAIFRVILDPAPASRCVYSPLPFNQTAVKQSTAPALQGPDPAEPYFTARFALPIPPDNDGQLNGSLLGLDPAVVSHNHSPGFEIMPNGDVLAVWFSGPDIEYGKTVRIVQARLRHGAEEFDLPELLFKIKGDQDVCPCQWAKWAGCKGCGSRKGDQDMVPLLWREGTTNWLFTGWGYPGRFRVSRSTDNGATWTMVAPTPQFSSADGFPQPINSAFRAPDGSMYVATDGNGGESMLWRSTDNSLTWSDAGGRTSGRHSTIVPLDQTGLLLSLGGKKQWEVTWASGRRTGEETLWASNGDKFWAWNHDLAHNVSTWTHWWSNGQKRLESQWDTNPTTRDLPTRHFRGLVAHGTARHWDANGREVGAYRFEKGSLKETEP